MASHVKTVYISFNIIVEDARGCELGMSFGEE